MQCVVWELTYKKPTLHALEYMQNRRTKILLHVSALLGCHHHGVLTVVKVELSNDPMYAAQPHTLSPVYKFQIKYRRNNPHFHFNCYVRFFVQISDTPYKKLFYSCGK